MSQSADASKGTGFKHSLEVRHVCCHGTAASCPRRVVSCRVVSRCASPYCVVPCRVAPCRAAAHASCSCHPLLSFFCGALPGCCVQAKDGSSKALFLDGVIQSCTTDEGVYHESLVHPAMVAHERGTRPALPVLVRGARTPKQTCKTAWALQCRRTATHHTTTPPHHHTTTPPHHATRHCPALPTPTPHHVTPHHAAPATEQH